jgi:ubiquinol-cytochrome c reductase cytochrome b subunit
VLLLFAVFLMSFLGYVLRWDQRGITGLRVALAVLQRVPLVGDELVLLVQGGPEITTLTLTRVYALHVIIVPLMMLLVVAYHVYLVVIHGTTTVAERKEPIETVEEQREIYQAEAEHPTRGDVFFPSAVLKMSPWTIMVFSLAIVLTLTRGPQALLPQTDLASESEPAEEWWFAWYSALVAMLPPAAAQMLQVLFPIVLFLLLVALPFIDRSPHRGWRKRPLATATVVLLVTAVFVLSGLRINSTWTGRPTSKPPAVPPGVELSEETEHGRMMFTKHGCTSCHSISGAGTSEVGTDLAQLRHVYSQAELREYILQPPAGVAMPSYSGRIPDEDLEAVVAFVLVAQTFPRNQE